VELIPGAVEALKLLEAAGFKLILVTNQSAIGRGMFDETRLADLDLHLRQILTRLLLTLGATAESKGEQEAA